MARISKNTSQQSIHSSGIVNMSEILQPTLPFTVSDTKHVQSLVGSRSTISASPIPPCCTLEQGSQTLIRNAMVDQFSLTSLPRNCRKPLWESMSPEDGDLWG